METLYALWKAFVCQTIHRNMEIVHVNGSDHLVTCQTCDSRLSPSTRRKKNLILTHWYFASRFYDIPTFLLMTLVAFAHQYISGHQGSLKHPPEHRNTKILLAELRGGDSNGTY